MGNSCDPSRSCCLDDAMPPPRSPGPLGINDCSDPDSPSFRGDSPGPVGLNDLGDPGSEHGWMQSFERAAGIRLISAYDSNVRLTSYVEPAQRMARGMLADFNSIPPEGLFALDRNGLPVHRSMAEAAVSNRNAQLALARERLSPGGRALSEAIKEEGKTLAQLEKTYSARALLESDTAVARAFGVVNQNPTSRAFKEAAERLAANPGRYAPQLEQLASSPGVSQAIVRASGSMNRAVTVLAKVGRVAGPGLAVVGVGMSVYQVVQAPEGQRLYVAGRETSGFAGGTLAGIGGGMAAGWLASLACGPAAPVCAIAVTVVVVGAASYAGGAAAEAGYEAIAR